MSELARRIGDSLPAEYTDRELDEVREALEPQFVPVWLRRAREMGFNAQDETFAVSHRSYDPRSANSDWDAE